MRRQYRKARKWRPVRQVRNGKIMCQREIANLQEYLCDIVQIETPTQKAVSIKQLQVI